MGVLQTTQQGATLEQAGTSEAAMPQVLALVLHMRAYTRGLREGAREGVLESRNSTLTTRLPPPFQRVVWGRDYVFL